MSEDASAVLWSGRTRSGALSVRLLTLGRQTRDGKRREALDGCEVGGRAGTAMGRLDDEQTKISSWNASGFRILHPRDPYYDVWGHTELTPEGGGDEPSDAAVIASAMFDDGEWVALLRSDGSLHLMATRCRQPARHRRNATGSVRGGQTARGAAWQELLAPPARRALRCASASLVATGCSSRTILILPGRDCPLFGEMARGKQPAEGPESGSGGALLSSACLSPQGTWGWCQSARLSPPAADALACSVGAQSVPMHRVPAADMPGPEAAGAWGKRDVPAQHWRAPACRGGIWRSILVAQGCWGQSGGGGRHVHVMLMGHEQGREGSSPSSASPPAAGAGGTFPSPALSIHLLQTISSSGQGDGSVLPLPLALDVSGRMLAIGGGEGAPPDGKPGAAEGGGSGGREVRVMEWHPLSLTYRDAGNISLGRATWGGAAPGEETEVGRGRVRGLAVLTLQRPFILAALAPSSAAPPPPLPQPSGYLGGSADCGAPRLVAASTAQVRPPAPLAFARQESFYITPACVYPVDRACAQPALAFYQEWAGAV